MLMSEVWGRFCINKSACLTCRAKTCTIWYGDASQTCKHAILGGSTTLSQRVTAVWHTASVAIVEASAERCLDKQVLCCQENGLGTTA